jgi:hypothetical protein
VKQSILLRIASAITLLYFAGHTLGMPWTPSRGPEEITLLEAMKSHRFNLMGSVRTYWDFYFGFGILISVYLLVQAVVLWQLATLAKTDAVRVRPFVASFFISYVANAILVWKFFFALPLVMAIAIAICLAWAFISVHPSSPA